MLNGYELKRIRQFYGISQSQLANYLGITNRMIIWIEKCEKEPSQELYDKWIRALYSDDIHQTSKRKVTSSNDLKKNKKIQKEQQKKQTANE